MVGWLLQHLHFLRKALPGRGDSSRQLAVGVALGVMLGLIAKDNLLAALIGVVIAASTVNVGIAMITALAVSFAAMLIDPALDQIGETILTQPSLQNIWKSLYQMPLGPWTRFNNTIVMGGFALGCGLFYPSYRLSRALFDRYWTKPAKAETNLTATGDAAANSDVENQEFSEAATCNDTDEVELSEAERRADSATDPYELPPAATAAVVSDVTPGISPRANSAQEPLESTEDTIPIAAATGNTTLVTTDTLPDERPVVIQNFTLPPAVEEKKRSLLALFDKGDAAA